MVGVAVNHIIHACKPGELLEHSKGHRIINIVDRAAKLLTEDTVIIKMQRSSKVWK